MATVVYSNSFRFCSSRVLTSLSNEAVELVLREIDTQELTRDAEYTRPNYKYACRSKLDSIAFRAMLAVIPHKDPQKYLNTGVKAVRGFLAERPDFFEEEKVVFQRRSIGRKGGLDDSR